GSLDDAETIAVGLVDKVQTLNFSVAGGAAQYPFRRRLAPQAQAVDDAYALRVANAKGNDATGDALLHTQVITALIRYSEALAKLVGNPVKFDDDAFLEALTNRLGTPYTALLKALNDFATTWKSWIEAQSEAVLNQLSSALSAYADFVVRQYLDPIVENVPNPPDINTV